MRDLVLARGLERHVDEVYQSLRNLAVILHAKHFPEVRNWRPEDNIKGLILQIDNMTSGMVRKPHD